jgi:hypothetical protein
MLAATSGAPSIRLSLHRAPALRIRTGRSTGNLLSREAIGRSAARTRHDSGRIGWTGLGLPLFKLWIDGETGDDALAAGTLDDPLLRRHRETVVEVEAKLKSRIRYHTTDGGHLSSLK